MAPAFQPGEYLLVNLTAYRKREPARGDVVIVAGPGDSSKRFLKRIIGLPGEEIRLSEGLLFINGKRLHEPYLGGLPAYLGLGEFAWKLGNEDYFVMGDNRAHSTDSREFGPVSLKRIIGRAWLRVWPFGRLGTVK